MPRALTLRRWLAIATLLGALCARAEEPSWPRRIDAVEVRGISWTREFVVLRELGFRAGDTIGEAAWELATTRLWNTDLFSRVGAHLEPRDGQAIAVFELEERFSLNPLLSFGVGGGAWWFRAGATDNNWFGRFLEWGARYERFDVYNGGQGWLRDPRFLGRRLSGLVELDYLFRPRPEYVRRRLTGIAELSGEVDDLTRAGVRVEVFRDEYLAPRAGTPNVPEDLLAGQATGQLRIGRVDTVRLRQRGWSFEVRETLGAPSVGPSPILLQSFLEVLWFKMAGERWNFAVRGQGGFSSPAPTELQYFIGGLDLIRGYEDSLVRTHAFALANAEVRATIFDSMWFAIVGAVFVDGCIANVDGARALVSTGAGVRLLVPRLVKTGVRADLAVTLIGRPQLGASFGVYQFF